MPETTEFDVIVIGSGAAVGRSRTASHRPERGVLLLERGGYLTRERDNWSSSAVFVSGKYRAPEFWLDQHGHEFPPEVTTTSAATPSSTARHCRRTTSPG